MAVQKAHLITVMFLLFKQYYGYLLIVWSLIALASPLFQLVHGVSLEILLQ